MACGDTLYCSWPLGQPRMSCAYKVVLLLCVMCTLCYVQYASMYHKAMFVCSVCQNDCSGHGTCNQRTKKCACDVFWMENFFTSNFGPRRSNCGEWNKWDIRKCVRNRVRKDEFFCGLICDLWCFKSCNGTYVHNMIILYCEHPWFLYYAYLPLTVSSTKSKLNLIVLFSLYVTTFFACSRTPYCTCPL